MTEPFAHWEVIVLVSAVAGAAAANIVMAIMPSVTSIALACMMTMPRS